MKVNPEKFFASVRAQFGALNQGQVDGMGAILAYWEKSTMNDPRWLAYALGTAWHETGRVMLPIREGFADTDAEARAAVAGLYRRGYISRNYALPHANGKSYYGRGFVQLTHGANYEAMGHLLGIDLYGNPDRALEMPVATAIMFQGMFRGSFTGKTFGRFFNQTLTDWVGARRIINGMDKADLIAGYAKKFYAAIDTAN